MFGIFFCNKWLHLNQKHKETNKVRPTKWRTNCFPHSAHIVSYNCVLLGTNQVEKTLNLKLLDLMESVKVCESLLFWVWLHLAFGVNQYEIWLFLPDQIFFSSKHDFHSQQKWRKFSYLALSFEISEGPRVFLLRFPPLFFWTATLPLWLKGVKDIQSLISADQIILLISWGYGAGNQLVMR